MAFDLLERRKTKFVLWIPTAVHQNPSPPKLLLGTVEPGSAATFTRVFYGELKEGDRKDIWELDPNSIQPQLSNGGVYEYWFEIEDTSPEKQGVIQVTDPLAYTVDYRTTKGRGDHDQPASVIKFRDGKLWPCNVDGTEPNQVNIPLQNDIPDNNHLVIYELPASWARSGKDSSGIDVDIGTFSDVLALFDVAAAGNRFNDLSVIRNEAILSDLGVNALELLPAADAKPQGEWGYATAHYFAPDSDLGTSSDLVKLVEYIHSNHVRFFTDVVMAFGHDPYSYIAFDQFHLEPWNELSNSDSYQSHNHFRTVWVRGLRDGFGGRSWRYIKDTQSYEPQSGELSTVHPSWSFHKAHLHRWMSDFGVGGLRLDSVNNVASYAFLKSYKDHAWEVYNARYDSASSAKFLVIGEELSTPVDMIWSGSLNALWNEPWQGRLRSVILGNNRGDNFEWTVRKMVDCTLDTDHPFNDGAQAVNYITSHDTEGDQAGITKKRLFNFLEDSFVFDKEKRSKLAFACLLTSVGIPMIFAGEEFCDQHDRPWGQKQIDPVNYERKAEPWRTNLFNYVANLVRFRKDCPALGDDDTDFFFVDQSRGAKIMAWKRGAPFHLPVVVVANFSDEDTPGADYYIPNWPDRDRDGWREITQGRPVPREWVGREPLIKWEIKVYTYWK